MRVKSKKDRLNGVMAAVAEAIDVPREVLVNEPEVCLQGQSVLTITNHAGVGAYSESALWVRTAVGPLSVWGKGLFIERFSRETLVVRGQVEGLQFGALPGGEK